MASPTSLAIYERLPQYVRDADAEGQFLAFISLLGDQVDEIAQKLDAISYYPPDDGGGLGDTSALVDATQAGVLGDPRLHLKWLSQLLGVRLNTADSIEAQIDAVRYASSGWRLGTKTALADAARSVLTGSKYVAVEPHYADDPWAINIRTRASETPDGNSVIKAVLAKGAKPAGTVILNVFYSATWDDLETFRPTWADWEATWTEIEETNAPGDDPDNIPDPDQTPYVPPRVVEIVPDSDSGDIPSDQVVRMYYDKPPNNWTEYSANALFDGVYYYDAGYSGPDLNLTYGIDNNRPYREFTFDGGWPPGVTVRIEVLNGDLTDTGAISFGEQPDIIQFTVASVPVVPQVVAVVPTENATNVAVTDNIVVTFNMNLDADSVTTANFVLTEAVSGTVVPRAVSGGTAGPVTINPTASLIAGTAYTLNILGNGTTGVQGESDGEFMSLPYTTSFTTAGTAPTPTPTDAPKVVSTNPANNSTNQAITLEIAVRFSKAMKPTTFTSSSVVLTEVGTGVIPTTITYDTARFRISVAPSTPIKASKTYQVQLTTAIQDANGTALAAPYTYSWSTAVASTPDPDPGPTPEPSVRIPALPAGATQTYFNDFKTPLDFANDWWRPYDDLSTDDTGTWRPSQVQVSTSGDGYLELLGVKDATKKRAGAKSDLIFGGIALGKKSLPVNSFFEFRIRIDKGNGFGLAALTWPDSNKWPHEGEDDIIEIPRGDRSRGFTTWHYWTTAHKQIARSYPGSGSWPIITGFDGSKWNIWRSEWRTASRRWYLNGQFVFEITDPNVLEASPKQHLSFQGECAAGSFWVTPWDGTARSVTKIQVDWVRQGRLS